MAILMKLIGLLDFFLRSNVIIGDELIELTGEENSWGGWLIIGDWIRGQF